MKEQALRLFAEQLYKADYLHGYKSIDELWTLGIMDSLAILGFAELESPVLDIGPGGGLPGLVLAASLPHVHFVLLDSSQKACQFLSAISMELGLANVEVVHLRAEEFGRQNRETFGIVISRAVAELRILVEYCAAPLKVGGKAFFWKGPSWREELERAEHATVEMGMQFVTAHEYQLADRTRVIVELTKLVPTPSKYPRKPGIAEKRPL